MFNQLCLHYPVTWNLRFSFYHGQCWLRAWVWKHKGWPHSEENEIIKGRVDSSIGMVTAPPSQLWDPVLGYSGLVLTLSVVGESVRSLPLLFQVFSIPCALLSLCLMISTHLNLLFTNTAHLKNMDAFLPLFKVFCHCCFKFACVPHVLRNLFSSDSVQCSWDLIDNNLTRGGGWDLALRYNYSRGVSRTQLTIIHLL